MSGGKNQNAAIVLQYCHLAPRAREFTMSTRDDRMF